MVTKKKRPAMDSECFICMEPKDASRPLLNLCRCSLSAHPDCWYELVVVRKNLYCAVCTAPIRTAALDAYLDTRHSLCKVFVGCVMIALSACMWLVYAVECSHCYVLFMLALIVCSSGVAGLGVGLIDIHCADADTPETESSPA